MFCLKKLLFLGVSLISFSALAVPFWKAEKEGKHLYMLGTIHQGVSLSELSCAEKIEDKLKQSEIAFTEIPTTQLDLDIEERKKLHLGSKKEREEIMNKLTEDDKKAVQSRYNVSRLIIIEQMLSFYQKIKGATIKKDQGSFEDLSQKSQEFIKYYGLYAKDKSYYDYLVDLTLREEYEAIYFSEKYLDFEIVELAQENDIPIKQLDNNDNIISDLEEEIKKMEAEFETNYEITNGEIDQKIGDYVTNYVENYETTKEAFIEEYELHVVPIYKTDGWSSVSGKIENDALLKNRNELWVEKILSTSENADKALFIAGGAAHFIFSDNVLDMLEDEGFTIKKINEENCQF